MPTSFVYIARKPLCGCIVGVATDNRDRRTGDAVGEFIADGLIVERTDWQTYVKLAHEDTFMNCPHGQMPLPLAVLPASETGLEYEGVS